MKHDLNSIAVGILIFFLMLSPIHAREESGKMIITAEDIEKMNVLKIKDLLNRIPGVKAGESSVSLRGSYKVKVLLDGRPINDPTSSYGAIKWDMVSLKNIERMEIYKGKGGIEFGDDSSGGVIVITTKKIEAFHGSLEVYGGNLETQNYRVNCQGNKGALALGLSSGYESTGGFVTNNDKEKFRASAKIQYELSEDINFNFSGDYLQEERGLPGLPQYPTPHSRKDYEMFSSLFLAHVKDLKSKTYFNEAEAKNNDPDRNLNTSLKVKRIGENISISPTFGKWGKISSGIGGEWGKASGSRFEIQEEQRYWVFASKEISLKSIPLSFTMGLRGNFYSDFETVVNPEFKVSFKKAAYTLQFCVNRTNNIPSFFQRYNESSSTKPNPDLTMEKAENYSTSCFVRFNPSLSAGLSLFYSKITDRITYVRGDGAIGQYENFGEVTYKGVETSVDWLITEPFSLKASHTYLEAKDEITGNWLPCKARHRTHLDFIYIPVKNLSMALNTQYVSRQYARSDNKESIPEYFIADFRGEYNFKDFGLFCEIQNLWDKDYLYGDGYIAPPRTWIGGVNYSF